MDMTTVTTSALTSFITSLCSKGADAPAKTFNEGWEFVFGPLNEFLIKHNAIRKKNIDDFLQAIQQETSKIAISNLQVPPTHLLGPALEASKYYVDEKTIRDMFAKVIASSFDKSKNDIIHHAYVEIIKQLSPLDAKIFSELNSPFFLITRTIEKENALDILQNIYLSENYPEVNQAVALSLSNLSRIGLIHVTNNLFNIKIASEYDPVIEQFKNTRHYHQLLQQYDEENIKIITQPCNITELGFCFRNVCCPKNQ